MPASFKQCATSSVWLRPLTQSEWTLDKRILAQWEYTANEREDRELIPNQVVPHKTKGSRSRQKAGKWAKWHRMRNWVKNWQQHKCVRGATTSETGAFLWQLKCFLIAHRLQVWCSNQNNYFSDPFIFLKGTILQISTWITFSAGCTFIWLA